MQNPYQHYKN